MKYFVPLTMSDRDADVVMKLFWTLRDLQLANDEIMLNVVGMYNFVQMQKQIMVAETDYDDYH
jgi:hypothetical protein